MNTTISSELAPSGTASQVFEFGSHRVRTAGTLDAPLFCATDVCKALGMAGGARNAVAELDQDETELMLIPSTSGRKRAVFVNESGLFALILRSNKPEAKAFRKWVTSEVLPSIRKHGRYELAEQQKERLLAECFPHAAAYGAPIFSELIAALSQLHPVPAKPASSGTPCWARQVASWVYQWAIRVDGQQEKRRALNSSESLAKGHKDHSLLGAAADEEVRNVIRTGIAFARSGCRSRRSWKLQMDLAHGRKAIQLPLMIPLIDMTVGDDQESSASK